jgi:site-specific DNA-methyltransferase (adenine-specific)
MKPNGIIPLEDYRSDWKTPQKLYNSLNRIFRFDFDPCPVDPDFDGLKIRWKQSNYVNPPYGRELGLWVKKGFEESRKGKTVVMLIPSRTDTCYWHKYVMRAKEIWFVKSRLKFDDQKYPAPFPSVIVIFKKKETGATIPAIKSVDTSAQEL